MSNAARDVERWAAVDARHRIADGRGRVADTRETAPTDREEGVDPVFAMSAPGGNGNMCSPTARASVRWR